MFSDDPESRHKTVSEIKSNSGRMKLSKSYIQTYRAKGNRDMKSRKIFWADKKDGKIKLKYCYTKVRDNIYHNAPSSLVRIKFIALRISQNYFSE